MSLLISNTEQNFIEIAQVVFLEQFKRDPKLEQELDERRKRLMYDDVVYNISFLMTSVRLQDENIFTRYAKWIYELLCNLMKDLDRDRIMEHMVVHYRVLAEILADRSAGILSESQLKLSTKYLSSAIEATKEAVTNVGLSSRFADGEHYEIRKAYLDALLRSDTRAAHGIIAEARKDGLSIIDIYENILTKTMVEVGNLWHRHIITVDKEHYVSSVTQTIMSSFYEEIFSSPRKNKTLVSCAIGSELHEMGVRMVSDLFEYRGWDTYYLGAALPKASLLEAIGDHRPDLVAISVTMPVYLVDCEEMVLSIKDQFPGMKIAVGGQAFRYTDEIWKKWGVDFYSETAFELVKWAEDVFNNGGNSHD